MKNIFRYKFQLTILIELPRFKHQKKEHKFHYH